MTSSLHSGTVTFLFTDIEGSTQLLRELGERYADLVRDHRQILREAAGVAGGTEVDTQGDAFFFSFQRARDAVGAAAEAQRRLRSHTWPEGREVRVRMGLHTGEPTVGEEGYLGLDVVRAARICSAANGGQILLSETTRALVGRDLPQRLELNDLGAAALKDLEDERLFELVVDEERGATPRTAPAATPGLGEQLAARITKEVESEIMAAFEEGSPSPGRTRESGGRLSRALRRLGGRRLRS